MKSHQQKDDAAPAAPLEVLGEIPLASIRPSPTNPRKHFDAAEIAGLAKSIEAHGLLQRIIVRPLPDDSGNQPQFFCGKWSFVGFWEIVAGERRFRAVSKLGWATMPVVVRRMSTEEVLQVQLVENLQRTDVSAIEFARGLKALRDVDKKVTLKQIAARIGKSEAVVRGALLLVDDDNPPELIEAIEHGWILPSVAEIVARLPAENRLKATAIVIPQDAGNDAMGFRLAKHKLSKRFGPKEPKKAKGLRAAPFHGVCSECARPFDRPLPAKVQASAARKTSTPKKVVDDELAPSPAKNHFAAWRALSIKELDLSPSIDAHLYREGIETIGDLADRLDTLVGWKPAEVERLRVLVQDASEGGMPYTSDK